MGKPALADLRSGLATAPVLFAREQFPELGTLMDRKFEQKGDIEQAVELVLRGEGLKQTKQLALVQAEYAIATIRQLSPSPERDALEQLARLIVLREK